MAHAELAARRFAHQREGLGNQIGERGTGGEARLERARLLGELIVRQRLHRGFEAIDRRNRAAQLLDQALITAAENGRQ